MGGTPHPTRQSQKAVAGSRRENRYGNKASLVAWAIVRNKTPTTKVLESGIDPRF